MRFLVDRCAGRRRHAWLVAQGHDALHIADFGSDPGDAAILARAAAERRILVSIDTDFGVLVFRDAAAHAGVVRLPDMPSERRIAIMSELIDRHSSEMEAGAIITVKGNVVRITWTGRPPKPPGAD